MNTRKLKQTEIGKIPEDWRLGKIGDLVRVYGGFAIKSSDFVSSGIPVIKIKNIQSDGSVNLSGVQFISKEDFSRQKEIFKLRPGDFVIAMTGATIGKIGKIPDLYNQYMLNQRVATICSKNMLDKEFIFQIFRSLLIQNEIINLANGAAQQNISSSQIESINIAFPKNKEERKQIAEVLSSLDSKIELNNKMNKTLEEIGQVIFKEWFVDFEFPNENGKPYKSSDGKMIESEFGMIPEGWKVSKIGEIVSPEKYAIVDGPFGTQMKIEEYQEEGVPIIEMGFLEGYPFYKPFKKFISEEKFEEVKRSAVKKGDIVISKTGTLGLLGIMTDLYEKAIIVSRLAKITPNTEKISRYYLFFILKKLADEGYWNQISSGSTMPLFNLTHIKNKQIVLPKKRWMDIFETTISNFYDQILNNLKENQTLSLIRDTLLPKLMSGEIRVI